MAIRFNGSVTSILYPGTKDKTFTLVKNKVYGQRQSAQVHDLSFSPSTFQPQPKRNRTTNIKSAVLSADMTEKVIPAVLIGAGRIGLALAAIGGDNDVVIRRGDIVPQESSGPIYVCTRNDALESVVSSTPQHRQKDLIFLQNGMIEPWLESKGLQDNTQLLVYFAVAKIGQTPIDGITDVNPEGLTAVTGPWAQSVAARLHAGGLTCKILDPEEFRKSMLEKLIWISAFMLVGARHPGATVGDVEKVYNREVVELIEELASSAAAEKGVNFSPGLVDRLCAYARSVADYPTAVKEFEWRNGWFFSLTEKALREGRPDPSPKHTSWLKEVGAI